MIKILLTTACLGFAVLPIKAASETWDLTLIRQDESGAVLAKTSTTTTVVGENRACIGEFPLRIDDSRQWVVRIELYEKQRLLNFCVDEPPAPGDHRSVQGERAQGLALFESNQAWQGSGRYTLCTFGGERLVASIGLTGEKDLPERVPAHSVALVRRSADGKSEWRCSVPWMPDPKKGQHVYFALPTSVNGLVQRGHCWLEETEGQTILRMRLSPVDTAAVPSNAVSHDLWLRPRTDGQAQTACEQDGEKLEIQLLGGIAP